MALVKGENVYADDIVAAADLYFTDHISSATWLAASETLKKNCIVTGTAILDNLEYSGVAADLAQSMAFPRVGEFFDPRIGGLVYYEDEPYPSRLVKASFEMALHLLNNPDLLTDTGGITDLDIKGISLKNIRNPSEIPSSVYRMIRPLLSKPTNSWWRAN